MIQNGLSPATRASEIIEALTPLQRLSAELSTCLSEFRAEKKNGQLDLNFSQGSLASIEVMESFSPGNEIGSFSPVPCARHAVAIVRGFMTQKKSGQVSLVFNCGDIAQVKSYLRLRPSKKTGA
jgi:hypothetical protein